MEEKKLEETNTGASLFGRSSEFELMNDDPLEEIFALNLGDFLSECLISDDLAQKIGKSEKEKIFLQLLAKKKICTWSVFMV